MRDLEGGVRRQVRNPGRHFVTLHGRCQPAGDTTLGWERLERTLRNGRQEGRTPGRDPSSTGMSVKMPGEFGGQGRLDHHQPWMPCQKTETWLKLS